MKVLFAGETFIVHETHIKGVDSLQQTRFVNEVDCIRDALNKGGIEFEHVMSQMVPDYFPTTVEALREYDAILVSDVGANSFLLSSETVLKSKIKPNRLEIIRQYVEEGGGFCMIGGYMTFNGIGGKARYHNTPIEELLPVELLPGDDRYEIPEGARIAIERPEHQLFAGIEGDWPMFLGYNILKAKPGTLLASHEGNAFIAAWDYGRGRSVAFASDCAPHWGSEEFVNWEHYGRFWCNLVRYLAKK